jgi:hypothetical protein
VQKCDLFCNDLSLLASPYNLTSLVPLSDFRDFVSALEGSAVQINNSNFGALSCLCEEFGFGDLSGQLSEFRSSSDFKEERMPTEQSKILQQLRAQELALESLLGRVVQLETSSAPQNPWVLFGHSGQPWAPRNPSYEWIITLVGVAVLIILLIVCKK